MAKQQTLGFIGAGNMAASLIGGLVADGYQPGLIWASDVDSDKLAALRQRYGIGTTGDNAEIVAHCQTIVLAVKPQMLQDVVRAVAECVRANNPLILSIAAGIREAHIEAWLGGSAAVVRCMPNTPAMVRTGATALHANAQVSAGQRDTAELILRSVGLTVWVDDEAMLDAVTAVSGSGPAYFFLMMEAMEEAAVQLGLSADVARLLTQQTALGAARIAIEAEESPAILRERVTSPGGTTERAVAAFETAGFKTIVADALRAARLRAEELSEQLGGS